MKTLQKTSINKLPKANIVIDNEKYAFLNGIEMFTEKTALAKEALKNVKLPLR